MMTRNSGDDFTGAAYRAILQKASEHYRFVPYSHALADNVLFLRHDCDVSLNRALAIAQIEYSLHVKSTFFLLLHGPFYNLLERSQVDLVRRIIDLGHDIGLHFDAAFYDARTEAEIDALISAESTWLSSWFEVDPTSVSFHNPDTFTLECERDRYGGLVNCYSASFKRDVTYCSDSNGHWRYERMLDVVDRPPTGPLQLLIHPEWWQESPMPPRARVVRAVAGRAEAVMRDYDVMLETAGRANISGPAGHLRALSLKFPSEVVHLDRLWNAGELDLVCLGLLRLLAILSPSAAPGDEIGARLLAGEPIAPDLLEEACTKMCMLLAGAAKNGGGS